MPMVRVRTAAAFAAAAAVAFQPCLAATDFQTGSFTEQRAGAFAGASLRVPLGAREAPRPSLRLQLSSTLYARDSASGAVRTFRPAGLELGAASARPALFVGGQSASAIAARRNIHGSTGTTVLIIGGVVVAVLLVAVLLVPPEPGPSEGDF